MLKFGYITELDVANGLARVNFQDTDIVSSLLPISAPGAKADKYSFPLVINEQVWCIMDDNCEYGVIGGAIYSAKDKPPGEAGPDKISITIGASKLQVLVDRSSGNLTIKSSGKISIESAEEVEIKSPSVKMISPTVSVTGALSAATVAAGGFSGVSGAAMNVTADIETSGKITASDDVVSNGKSLKSHIHTAPSGGGNTSGPL